MNIFPQLARQALVYRPAYRALKILTEFYISLL